MATKLTAQETVELALGYLGTEQGSARHKEIIDYFQHVNTVVLPMVHRLALCNEFLRLGSSDNIDYLRKNGFNGLRVIVDAIRQNEHTS